MCHRSVLPVLLLVLSVLLLGLVGCSDSLVGDPADEPSVTKGRQTDSPVRAAPSPQALPGPVVPVIQFDALQQELPEGIAIDRFGHIYVSLTPRGEIRRVQRDGSTTPVAQFPLLPGDFGVVGLTVDPTNTLYAAVISSNPDVHGVWKLSPEGTKKRLPGTDQIGFPNDLAVGARGTLYISDSSGGAVWRVAPEGVAELWVSNPTLEGTGNLLPGFTIGANGIAFSSGSSPGAGSHPSPKTAGGLFVANTDKGLLAYIPIQPNGRPGTPEVIVSDPVSLLGLDGIRLDATGRVYGTVNVQNKVIRISRDGGSIETIADTGLDFPASLVFGARREQQTLFITNFAALTAQAAPDQARPGVVKLRVGPPGLGRSAGAVE